MKASIKKILSKSPGLFKILSRIYWSVRPTIDVSARVYSRIKWRNLAVKESIYLELGAGAKKGESGWTTVDLHGADISWDLRKGIPLASNSVDKIYTSHLFEHIPYVGLCKFISECYRVLKPSGSISVSVPNARYYIDAYIEGREFMRLADCYQPAIVNTGSRIDQVNYIAYMDGQHCYLFDEENLVKTLKIAPFSNVKLRDFDRNIDMEGRRNESIYAVAIK